MKILKIELRPENGRSLKAFADVEFADGMVIRAFRIVQEPGKRAVVWCPQISVKEPGRPPYFKTLITLPDALKGEVDLAVLNAWKNAMAGQKENPLEPRYSD